ncbi:MAG: methyltransferase domain-containing protein [Saprospiraceae bacterium]|nr:methyltransferase domain-containing protein [Saprospiraceae bacterium]
METSVQRLDQDYWNGKYKASATGWDLGMVSPILKSYFDSIDNKQLKILIPGCGNAHEADYLLKNGFTNVTIIDIAPTLVDKLKIKHGQNPDINIIQGDFFEHSGHYDLIIEQTFFCALPTNMRQKYVLKMHELLVDKGLLVGLLFDRIFDSGPPFGGSKKEYESIFRGAFTLNHFSKCKASVSPRSGSELFIELEKKRDVVLAIYQTSAFSDLKHAKTIKQCIISLDGVINVSLSSDLMKILVVCEERFPLNMLQNIVDNKLKFKIEEI